MNVGSQNSILPSNDLPVKLHLYFFLRDLQSRGDPVDHAANALAMGLAEGGDPEGLAPGAPSCHDLKGARASGSSGPRAE
eukprot:scaffold143517_cov45-Prasinocladus_malaysianus.AAC.1